MIPQWSVKCPLSPGSQRFDAPTRHAPVKGLLPGRRTALTVCQAINIAMTVVFPAPVASFSASRISSGLASLLAEAKWSTRRLPNLDCGATSVRQIAVSTPRLGRGTGGPR